jgi:hypothetical protein
VGAVPEGCECADSVVSRRAGDHSEVKNEGKGWKRTARSRRKSTDLREALADEEKAGKQ